MTIPQNMWKNILIAFASLLIGISVGLYIPRLMPKSTTTDVDSKPITQKSDPEPEQITNSRVTLKRSEIGPNEFQKYGLPDPCEVLEKGNWEELDKLKFHEPATKNAHYKNQEKGVALYIPYNPEWGGERFRFEPYEEYKEIDEGILFGTMFYNAEGCGGYYRQHSLSFLPPESIDTIIAKKEAAAKRSQEAEEVEGIEIATHTLRNKQILEYNYIGMCAGGEVIVIGKKYNYAFSSLCFADFTDYAKMIAGMEFLD